MSTTVQIEQGRWRYLDARLVSSGAGVASQTDTHVTVAYKKYGGTSFTTVDLDGTTTTTAADAASGATKLVLTDSSIFPPDFGQIIIDPAGANTTVTIKSNDTASNTITLTSALGASVASGKTIELVRWGQVSGPPNGYYSILFNPSDLDTLDQFTYTVTDAAGTDFDFFERVVDIVPATTAATESKPAVSTCIIKDHILDLSGNAVVNVPVSARLLALPTLVSGVAVEDKVITAKTDANGFFQLTLIQGATVDVVIPAVGYRRTLVVPSSTSANLFEIS